MWSGSENQVELYLVRHGYTKLNEEHRYLGCTNVGLSEAGAQAVQNKIYPADFDLLFTGPMLRCLETAEILFPNMKRIEIPEWIEIDFGDFEGKNYMELSDNPDYQRWIDSGGTLPFPNGESREQFIERTMAGFGRFTEYIKQKEPHKVAAVMHGGNIMAILFSIIGGDYFSYQVKPAEGYKMILSFGQETKIKELEELK